MSRWTAADLQAKLARRTRAEQPQPDGTVRYAASGPPKITHAPKRAAKTRRPLPHAVAERDEAPALGAAVPREAQGADRVTVRFVGYRVRPLDPDNFAGSTKDLLDGLRHAGLISGDEPWRIRLETEQVRVGTFAEERTEIVISPPRRFHPEYEPAG